MADATPLPRRGLFDRDWQKVLIIELAILAGLALLWVVWQIISPLLHTIMLFALGAVLAFALTVPVDQLASRIGNRVAAIAVVYVLVALVVVGGLTLLAGPFAVQASALVTDLPRYAIELQTRLSLRFRTSWLAMACRLTSRRAQLPRSNRAALRS